MVSRRDVVIFLGAGFSCDADLPLMATFGPQSEADFETLRRHASNGDRYAAPLLVEAAETYRAFQRLCRRSPTLDGSNRSDNLETIFCIAEVLREAGTQNVTLEHGDISMDKLIERMQLWIWKIFQQGAFWNSSRETRIETYTEFVQLVKALGLWERSTVITTNYDLIFEYAAWKGGVACSYPFEAITHIKAGFGTDEYVHATAPSHGPWLPLCKLHGSVNYFEHRLGSDHDSLYVSADVGGDKSIGKSGNFKGKPAIFAVDAIWNLRDQISGLTPAIVPPSYAKLNRKEWLVTVWARALEALRTAKTILFIGYSMPPSDGAMRALIHGACATGRVSGQRRVIVLDPGRKTHENYQRLFGRCYHDIGYHGLRKSLCNGVLEKALAAAIANRCQEKRS